jgi:pyridoxal phosphate enzyme (YggS family)
VPDFDLIRASLRAVRDRMARAATRCDRDPDSVRLVAVSKTFPVDVIRAAADAGQVDFGENKVQEALEKIDRTRDLGLRWHLVGHLQSNKAKKAAEHFDTVHSADDETIIEKLDRAAAASRRSIELLIQVDLAGEPTKHGAAEDHLIVLFERAQACRAARVVGLMALPPATDDPEGSRAYFRALRKISDRIRASGVSGAMLAELSMGMSHDFEVAIEEGATLVRVGTAIFGRRS